jgi:hypothetical protein
MKSGCMENGKTGLVRNAPGADSLASGSCDWPALRIVDKIHTNWKNREGGEKESMVSERALRIAQQEGGKKYRWETWRECSTGFLFLFLLNVLRIVPVQQLK